MTPRQLWTAALRSGKYKQGQLKLEEDGAYCCLGVACLLAEEHGVYVRRNDKGEVVGGTLNYQRNVQEWLGLSKPHGGFENDNLINLNDGLGKTFEEIADVIDSEPEGMFND